MSSAPRRRLLYVMPSAFYLGAHWADRVRAASARYQVVVAVPSDSRVQLPDLGGVEVLDLAIRRRGLSPTAEWSAYRNVRRAVQAAKPDLVHAITARAVVYAGLAARSAGVPARVSSITGLGYLFGESPAARFLRPATRLAYRRALAGEGAVPVFEHPADRDVFVQGGLIKEPHTRVFLGGGVDLAEFCYSPEQPGDAPLTVVLASRLIVEKGIRDFAAAVRLLKKANVPARFVLVGDIDPGNPTSLTRSEIEGWVRAGLVEWWGFRRDIGAILQSAAIVCLPSYYREGAPRILMEAAAIGRAAVTVDAAGSRDVVHDGETGLLVPARDPIALAEAIRRLLVNPDVRRQMGAAARRRAEAEFGSALAVERMLALYAELLAR